jgi:AcrR family transcriptional regulator
MADGAERTEPKTGKIRRGRKFDQVLEGAREVFLASGFEGASVDDIARAAGVSKATLYSYFPDKRVLFTEMAKAECQHLTEVAVSELDLSQPVEAVLRDAARKIIGFLTSDFGQGVFRMCVAESARFPAFGCEFYEAGPGNVTAHLVHFLHKAADRGELEIEDFELAADQFHELCKADIFPKLVFNLQTSFSEAEIDRVVTGAVEMFLARYGTS